MNEYKNNSLSYWDRITVPKELEEEIYKPSIDYVDMLTRSFMYSKIQFNQNAVDWVVVDCIFHS